MLDSASALRVKSAIHSFFGEGKPFHLDGALSIRQKNQVASVGGRSMRSVVITGASRGIGLEFVRQYFADGYKVYATCHKIASAEHLLALPSNGREKIDVIEMDVTNAAQVKALARRLNGMPIDILINNAGTVEPI